VAVLGLGLMGAALAGALLGSGHPVTVWNRTPGRDADLLERGAARADSAAHAAASAPLVVLCVLDHAAARGVLEPLADVLAGRTLVNLTSGTPEEAAETAAWAEARGIAYLDGAIMATPQHVGAAGTAVLYSGPGAAFDEHRDTLLRLGGASAHLGEAPGLASLYDTALLGLMWASLAGWAHGAALLRAEGVAATRFTPFALHWLGAVGGFFEFLTPQVDSGSYPPDATLDVQVAALRHLVHASRARGVDTTLPDAVGLLMERAIAAGHGGASFGAVTEVLTAPAP
jgi:3-hydroxyisobutyrate dehydrogenase-like beta-hydroxyacid dehydrogenase